MTKVPNHILLGDIGGTNARFALSTDDRLGPSATVQVNAHRGISDAIQAFLIKQGETIQLSGIALAAAGAVEGDRCVLTNSPWVIDASELRKTFKVARVLVVNDFEAIAWSLPQLGSSDVVAIGGGAGLSGAPMAVLGPGTGLGVSCLICGPGRPHVLRTEGGHATLPATTEQEGAIIAQLRQRFGHVSIERVLSGDGLVNLYQAMAALDRVAAPPRSAAQVTEAALAGACAASRAALEAFCAMLGTVAGNVALTFGARGGVYLAGGILPRIVPFLAQSEFRARFEAKGRFDAYLRAIPSRVIVHPVPAFLGLTSLMAQAGSGPSGLWGQTGPTP